MKLLFRVSRADIQRLIDLLLESYESYNSRKVYSFCWCNTIVTNLYVGAGLACAAHGSSTKSVPSSTTIIDGQSIIRGVILFDGSVGPFKAYV